MMYYQLLLLLIPLYANSAPIPGCADIDNLEATFDFATTKLDDLLLCFCKIRPDELVTISCHYGSTIDDLGKATALVAAANRTVDTVVLSHVDFNESTGLTDGIFADAPMLVDITIVQCAQSAPLVVDARAFTAVQATLRRLVIEDCQLHKMPAAAIAPLTQLEHLSLARNKIINVSRSDLSTLVHLKSLNLAGNFITDVESGTLSQLGALDTLIIGEHNYMNDSLMDEIGRCTTLRTLDLSKADALYEAPVRRLGQLNQLQVLLLSGCSLTNVSNETFAGLDALQRLDLRVNLIRHIEPGAFARLTQLERLSLAGNYLSQIEPGTFDGLNALTELDLGWNEFRQLSAGRFVIPSIESLDLRHNLHLTSIDRDAFTGMTRLHSLNLSEIGLERIDADSFLTPLINLQTIDLGGNLNLSHIDERAFANNRRLASINLAGCQLRTMSADVIRDLVILEKLDLSRNPWQCDIDLRPLIDYLIKKHLTAAETGSAFHLQNTNDTVCDRPYTLRGETITALNLTSLAVYNSNDDTTTTTTTTTQSPPSTSSEPYKFTLPPFVIGDALDTTTTSSTDKYDINAIDAENDKSRSDDQKQKSRELPIMLIAAIGIGALVTLLILIAVICYVRKKKRQTQSVSDSTEMNDRSRNSGAPKSGAQIRVSKIEDTTTSRR